MGILTRLVALSFILAGVQCLFEDQAGTYDWRQQFVGRPIHSHIDYTTKKFFVATDQNLLAALNIKNGNIAWRKIFESNDLGRIDYVLWAKAEIVVVTGNGQRVQSFNYNNGFANWEFVLFTDNKTPGRKFVGIESKRDKEVFYFTDGKQICSVGFKEKICVDLPADGGYEYTGLFETSKGVFVTGLRDKFIQQVQFTFTLSSIVDKKVSQLNGQLDWIKADTTNCIKAFDSDQLTCYSPTTHKIYTQTPEGPLNFDTFHLPSPSTDATTSLIWASSGKYLLASNDHLILLQPDAQSQHNLLPTLTINSVSQHTLKTKDNELFLVYAQHTSTNEITFTARSLTDTDKPEHVVKTSQTDRATQLLLLQFNANLVETKSGQFGLLTLCFFNDYSMSMVNTQGVSYFTREEALAYVSKVEMVDFPLSHLQEELEDEFSISQQDNVIDMFVKRIRTQVVQVKDYITVDLYHKLVGLINQSKGTGAPVAPGAPMSSVDELTRDEFNLNKIIVVATHVGKVFGIYTSANGHILWSFFLPQSAAFTTNGSPSVSLFLQRSASHVAHEPQAVFVSRSALNEDASFVFFFNPLTGQASSDQPKEGLQLNYRIQQAFLTPEFDANFLRSLILLDDKNRLHFLPEANALAASEKFSVVYTVQADEASGDTVLTGLAMAFSSEKPLAELWKVRIEGEQVQAIASVQAHDKIHSHGKVLGDRSVLYKYLNPNLIGAVTTGEDGQRIPFVNVYLIDTVTGNIVQSFNHKRAKGPVNIVHSENWFFYSFYNMKNRRFEVTSVELFEGSRQFNSSRFSSLDDIRPIVFSKSYVVQKAFNAMQVTLTEKGITTKNVVVACQSGIIIEIPWALIDPRRPLKMTDIEREENLLPYMPEIPLNYEFSLNYYNYVYNVRGIATSPTGLESTSLVFAYGLDIYFTRVFPSKTFDLLREDFDYLFVSTLMFGLLIGTVLAKKLASSSNLQKAWK